MLQSIVTQNLAAIAEACRQHHVRTLHVFGSAVRNDFSPESDVDFVADFDLAKDGNSAASVFSFYDNKEAFRNRLATTLGRDVDVVELPLIRNRYLRYFINQEKVLLYGEA